MTKEKLLKTYTFQLQDSEIALFENAFELSGFRSRSELIRMIINKELPKYYEVKK